MQLSDVFKQKITTNLYLSASFFITCMLLDFYITNAVAQGNYNLEGNALARWWWQVAGSLRFIEIPVYATAVLVTAYIINYKSTFFPLFWLNLLALNHLMGFLSWLPYGTLDFLDSAITHEWAIGYAFSLISASISMPLTLLQVTVPKIFNKKRG